jgi:hypothetical protein
MPECPWLSFKHGSSVRLFVRGVMSAHAGVASFSQTRTNHLGHVVCGTKSFCRRHCHAGANLAAQDQDHHRVTAQAARLAAGIPAVA